MTPFAFVPIGQQPQRRFVGRSGFGGVDDEHLIRVAPAVGVAPPVVLEASGAAAVGPGVGVSGVQPTSATSPAPPSRPSRRRRRMRVDTSNCSPRLKMSVWSWSWSGMYSLCGRAPWLARDRAVRHL